MLFVSYAQRLSLAAHTAGAALIEDFNEKNKSLLKSEIRNIKSIGHKKHTKTNFFLYEGKEGTLKASHTKEKIITLFLSLVS